MNQPPDKSHGLRFGWIVPKPGGVEFDVRIGGAILAPEVWQDIQSIVDVVCEIRPYLIDFLILEEDFRAISTDLQVALKDRFEAFPFNHIGGTSSVMAHVAVQRTFSNFLSSTSAFRARTTRRLKQSYGRSSSPVADFEAALQRAENDSFAFRLLHNLRNYAQHNDSPIDIIPIHGERDPAGNINLTITLCLRRDTLLEDKRMAPYLMSELKGCAELIPLLPLIRAGMAEYRRLFLVLIGQRHSRFAQYAQYIQAVLLASPMPKGAIPVIWEGEVPETQEFRTNVHSFSLDEFLLLTRVVNQLGYEPLSCA